MTKKNSQLCWACSKPNSESDNFCDNCGSDITVAGIEVDKKESLEKYAEYIKNHTLDDDDRLIEIRKKLLVTFFAADEIENDLRKQQDHFKSCEVSIRVDFNNNIIKAFAGHDTYLEFRIYNETSSSSPIFIQIDWDDPDLPDEEDFKIRASQKIQVDEIIEVGSNHVFQRIGLKRIDDACITIEDDKLNTYKFNLSTIKFFVENPTAQNINQFSNNISIEGRGVVDASTVHKTSENTAEFQDSWKPLALTPIYNFDKKINEICSYNNKRIDETEGLESRDDSFSNNQLKEKIKSVSKSDYEESNLIKNSEKSIESIVSNVITAQEKIHSDRNSKVEIDSELNDLSAAISELKEIRVPRMSDAIVNIFWFLAVLLSWGLVALFWKRRKSNSDAFETKAELIESKLQNLNSLKTPEDKKSVRRIEGHKKDFKKFKKKFKAGESSKLGVYAILIIIIVVRGCAADSDVQPIQLFGQQTDQYDESIQGPSNVASEQRIDQYNETIQEIRNKINEQREQYDVTIKDARNILRD